MSGLFVVVSYEDRQFDESTKRIEGVFDSFDKAQLAIDEYFEKLRSDTTPTDDYYRYFGIEHYKSNSLTNNYILWLVSYHKEKIKFLVSGIRNIGFSKLNQVKNFDPVYRVYVHSDSESEAVLVAKDIIIKFMEKS